MRRLTLQHLAVMTLLILAVTAESSYASISPDSLVALRGPSVVKLTVHYEGDFQVPYPEFLLDERGFSFTPQLEIYSEEVDASWSGTGFFITSDGYLLTNAHIAGSEYYKRFGYLLDHAREVTDLFIDDQLIAFEQYDFFLQSYYEYLIDYGNFTSERKEIKVVFGRDFYPAVMVASGDPIGVRTSRDVALLKIEAPDGLLLPTSELGNSDGVRGGDDVTVLGFPLDSDDPTEVQAATGKIIDVKSIGEVTAFQTDAEITFGYSGGPALDRKGVVIGVAAFGALSPLAEEPSNFLIPINLAESLLETASIENTRSPLDDHYEKGLRHFRTGEYNSSIEEFNIVLSLNPAHPYAQYFLSLAKQEEMESLWSTSTGNDKSSITNEKGRTLREATRLTEIKNTARTENTLSMENHPANLSRGNNAMSPLAVIATTIMVITLLTKVLKRKIRRGS